MTPVSVKESLIASWKFWLSFRKRDWELGDYPVVIRKQNVPDLEPSTPRFTSYRYWARIVNWWVMTGGGDTPEEALKELAVQFNQMRDSRQREGKSMPRPGMKVPLEFAASKRVYAHPDLTDDFIARVLGIEWAFISDQSSLWDFHTETTNDALYARIKDVYGVDVSDIESGNLAKILDRIAVSRSR